MSNMGGYTQSCVFYMQEYFNLNTPSADQKGMDMANKIWDGFVELFDWYDKVDDKTLDIHNDDIRYDLMFMNYMLTQIKMPGEGLNARVKELKFDKVADYYAKYLNSSITKKMRQPNFDQQSVANDVQELHSVMTIASMCGNNAMAQKVQQMVNTQFDAMEASAPGLGTAFRNFFNNMNKSEEAEEAESTEEPASEQE